MMRKIDFHSNLLTLKCLTNYFEIMNQALTINELTIVAVINNYDLTLCLPRFLQSSGIVPNDWNLNNEPTVNNQLVQTVYDNGVNVVAQANRCLFAENIENKEDYLVESPQVANNYVQILPHLDYQAIGINLRGYIKLGSDPDKTRQDFFAGLLADGSWRQKGTKAMEAELNLNYTFEDKQLTLNVNNGLLQQPETEALPIILFTGNFSYDLSEQPQENKVEKIQAIITNWQSDLQLFKDVISDFPQVIIEDKQLTATST